MFTLTYCLNKSNNPETPEYDPNYEYFIVDVNISEEYCAPNDTSSLYLLRQKYKIFSYNIEGEDLTIDYGSPDIKFTTKDDMIAGIPYYKDYGIYRITAKAKKFTRLGENPMNYSFAPITNIIKVPSTTTLVDGDLSYMFYKDTYLTSLPQDFKLPYAISYISCFEGCTNLSADITNIWPDTIKTTSSDYFNLMFYRCSKITGAAPADKLWNNSNLSQPSYGIGTFDGCTSLTNYNDIPENWKYYEV
ncbi:MAG: hypothetical protein J6C46_00485 [Clostridia bacterium]|nr:hypothetical protein [Clostridia bacterium]